MDFEDDDALDPTKSKFGLLDLDRSERRAGDMKDWLTDGYPDALPIDTFYPPANGEKNGIKKELEDAAEEQRTLLFPVFDSPRAPTATTSSAGRHSSSTRSSSGTASTTPAIT